MLDVVSRLPVKMSNLAEWENVFADAWLSSVSELLLSAVTLALLLRQVISSSGYERDDATNSLISHLPSCSEPDRMTRSK